jgi:hypothetical protein
MHSPATMPDTIKATPETTNVTQSSSKHSNNTALDTYSSLTKSATPCDPAVEDTRTAHETPLNAHTPHHSSKHAQSIQNESSTPTQARQPTSRRARWQPNKWLSYAVENGERGMSTAEYAVGTIAACAFAALLFKVVSSPEVQEMLKSLIDRALKTNG